MRQLNVDRDLCIGCCRCVDFAPALFNMEDGLAVVTKQPDEDVLADANNALENCPAEAIEWKEQEC